MSGREDAIDAGTRLRFGQIKTFAVFGAAHGLDMPTVEASMRIEVGEKADSRSVMARIGTLQTDFPGTGVVSPVANDIIAKGARAAVAQAVALVSVWLQRAALHPVSGGHFVSLAGADEAIVAVPYLNRQCAIQSLGAAARIVEALFVDSDPASAQARVRTLISEFSKHFPGQGYGRDNFHLIEAARRFDIPWLHLSARLFQFGYGAAARRMNGLITDRNSSMAEHVAGDYAMREEILAHAGLPIAGGIVVRGGEKAVDQASKAKFAVVMRSTRHGPQDTVASDIRGEEDVRNAFARLAGPSGAVVIERQPHGDRYRYLVAGGKAISALMLGRNGVTGDGVHTVAELVEHANRGAQKTEAAAAQLVLDGWSDFILETRGLQRDSVPPRDSFVTIASAYAAQRESAASMRVGTSHADNDRMAERAANLAGAETAFVDVISPDIARSWRDLHAHVVEIAPISESIPGIYRKLDRSLHASTLQAIFRGRNGRIPIVAVTGTNGKSTVCQMVHRIFMAGGLRSGVATTQGVWIGNDSIGTKQIDKAGYPGGRTLLLDPEVEAAVIEMPRRGLLNMGFPFDSCTAAALTNIQDDHLGEDGIDSLETMTAVKARVLQRATRAVVVNADDPLCLAALRSSRAREAVLVSADPGNAAIADHLEKGGTAIVLDRTEEPPAIAIRTSLGVRETYPLAEIPATDRGRIRFNVENAMFAIGLALSAGASAQSIRQGLKDFVSRFETNPGRLNPVPELPFRMLVDFAHNNDAIRLLCDYVRQVDCVGRKIFVNYNGGRFRRYMPQWAEHVSSTFDLFVIGMDKKSVEASDDYRGLSYEDACKEFAQLIRDKGAAGEAVAVEPDMRTGIAHVLRIARPDDLIIVTGEPYDVWPVIEELKQAMRAPGRSLEWHSKP